MAAESDAIARERRITLHLDPEPLAALGLFRGSKGWNLLLSQLGVLIEEAAETIESRLSPLAWEYLELCAERSPAVLLAAHRFPEIALSAIARDAMDRGQLHKQVWQESPGHHCGTLLRILEHASSLEVVAVLIALRHRQECLRCSRAAGEWWTVAARQRCALLPKTDVGDPPSPVKPSARKK
jgi:hypothetical protein